MPCAALRTLSSGGKSDKGTAHPTPATWKGLHGGRGESQERGEPRGLKLQCVGGMGGRWGSEISSQQRLACSFPVAIKRSPGTLTHQSCFCAPGASQSNSRVFLIGEDTAETSQSFLPQVCFLQLRPRWLKVQTFHYPPPVCQSPSQRAVLRTRHEVPAQNRFSPPLL